MFIRRILIAVIMDRSILISIPIIRTPNVGRGSQLHWYNILCTHPELAATRARLFAKIEHTLITPKGCIEVEGFTKDTRPVASKQDEAALQKNCGIDIPTRFSPYVLALAQAQVLRPENKPPAYPDSLRKVKLKGAKAIEIAKWTWSISYLCYNRLCVNPEHLTWEPSWFNRLRDNCPGGDICIHRPRPCLAAHRQNTLIDWTDYT